MSSPPMATLAAQPVALVHEVEPAQARGQSGPRRQVASLEPHHGVPRGPGDDGDLVDDL